jgi:DNA repair exonuclease SbcCD nuclease subunit
VTTALLTDLHVGAGSESDVLERLESVVGTLNDEVAPDFVAVLGDLIQDGPDAATDRRRLAAVTERLDELDAPYRALAGNHDVGNFSESELATELDADLWGIGENRVFLNSARHRFDGARGEVGAEQRAALRDALGSLSGAFVFVHHPIHFRDLRSNYFFAEIPEEAFCGDKRLLLDDVEDGPEGAIRAVFNGHLHEPGLLEYRGLPHVTVDAFNKEREPTGETGAYAVVRDDERLDVTLHAGDGSETVYRR